MHSHSAAASHQAESKSTTNVPAPVLGAASRLPGDSHVQPGQREAAPAHRECLWVTNARVPPTHAWFTSLSHDHQCSHALLHHILRSRRRQVNSLH